MILPASSAVPFREKPCHTSILFVKNRPVRGGFFIYIYYKNFGFYRKNAFHIVFSTAIINVSNLKMRCFLCPICAQSAARLAVSSAI